MAREYLELQDRTLRHGFSATRYREDIKRWLNEAVNLLARVKPAAAQVSQRFTTTAGVAVYPLPVDLVRLRWPTPVRFLSAPDEPLTPLPLGALELDEEASGRPTAFALDGRGLRLWPTADGEYEFELEYDGHPYPPMEADDDRSPFADEFDQGLIDYALWHAYQREHDREFALHHKSEWLEARMRFASDEKALDPSPKQVPGMLAQWGDDRPERWW